YNSRLTIDNCDFRNNIGQQAGGAIYGTTSDAENNLYITNSRFISNTGDLGACIGGNGSYHDIIIDRCTFTQNVGGNYVIQIDDFTNARIYNSLLVGNSLAEGYASVLGVDEAVNVTTDDFMMANTTIANNINTYQFGPSNDIVYLGKSYYKIYNSIIYGNTPYQGRQLTAGRVIRNSIIQAGYAGGINVLNADPLFVNPNTNYSQAFDGSLYNYRLQSGSPAQNAGDNNYVYPTYNLDLDNTNRIDQNIVDMGSYESTFLATTGYNQQLIRFQYINSQKKIYLLNFELTNKEKVEIFSLNGSLVRQYLSPSNEIEINLMPGLYIVKVRGDSFKISVY
ncbi:MAG: T9SS type A sorting domain-containing protein, partial [Flavobacterium sp.]